MIVNRIRRSGRPSRVRKAWAVLTVIAFSLALPVLAYGHAVVFPRSSLVGSREQYVLRIPNEREVPTVRIEIRFPEGVRNPLLAEIPGWQIELIQDSAKKVIGAVWTGSLSPHRYVELPFVASNPRDMTSIAWPVIQTYASGEKIEWTGPVGSKSPASVTALSDPPIAWMNHHITAWIAGAALVLAFAALLVGLNKPSAAATT